MPVWTKGAFRMIGIPFALAYSNAGEWAVHRFVLHGWGKSKKSMWSFHFHEHHKACRKHEGHDPHYHRPLMGWHAQGKEALGLLAIGAAHLPLLPLAPFFTATVWYSILKYHRLHKRSHMDPEWARKNLPWHYDHHMGPDQEANWCVTHPWFDHVMKTRKPFAFTETERARQR